MKFESVKCDQCQRIQDGANHWIKMFLWVSSTGGNVIAIGPFADEAVLGSLERQALDLCGQGCAMKVMAKLLGWSSVLEAQKE